MSKPVFFALYVLFLCIETAFAQFDFSKSEPDGTPYIGGPRLGNSINQIWRAGIVIDPGTAISSLHLTMPVPKDWKEQRIVSVNEEKMDAGIASRISYQNLGNGALAMQIPLDNVKPAKPLEIVVAFEVQNYELLPPDEPDQYVIPKRVPPEIKPYLQESPCIESDDSKFARMFAEITKDRRSDWDKIESLYSFVQNNVKYDDTAWKVPARGALAVIKMPKGEWSADCKDMSCLFVALCRAGKIPARIVRVPEHCYAEFYLEMKQAKTRRPNRNEKPRGFWFPCQVSGTYAFGGIPEQRIILQKGDSFPDYDLPGKNTLFLKECFQGVLMPGSASPQFQWVHETEHKAEQSPQRKL